MELIWVTLLGACFGAFSLLVFRRWSSRELLGKTVNLIIAHLLEIQLFADEPILVLRAQRDLIAANSRMLLQLLKPMIIVLIPSVLLIALAEPFFGNTPLRPGKTALLTVRFKNATNSAILSVPPGIEINAPPVRIHAVREIVWRLRAVQPTSADLEISTAGTKVSRRITAATGLAWAPADNPLSSNAVIESVKIGYPPATILGMSWLVWFGLSSLLGVGILVFLL